MKNPKLYLLFALLVIPLSAKAQVIDSNRLKPPGEAAAQLDTSSTSGGYVMTKSPLKAILYSIVPGGGQFYNEQYWKVPLFAGAAGYFVWRVIYFHNLYKEKEAEANAVGRDSSLYPQLKLQREAYRDDRDRHAAYFIAVEILGMIDAYVGAHMFDFDVGDNISSEIYLLPTNPGIGLRMTW